jgi:hypothetical protein
MIKIARSGSNVDFNAPSHGHDDHITSLMVDVDKPLFSSNSNSTIKGNISGKLGKNAAADVHKTSGGLSGESNGLGSQGSERMSRPTANYSTMSSK